MDGGFHPTRALKQDPWLDALLEPISERELSTRTATLPTGATTSLGAALILVVLRVLGGYRMQLLLYAKGAGNEALTTHDCWYGVGAPA